MSEKKRLLKNTLLIALGNLGARATSFLLLPLYTSILKAEEYGTYDFIVAVSAFLLPIATMATNEAMFRFIIDSGKDGEDFQKIISHTLVIVICGCLLLGLALFGINLITPIAHWQYIFGYVIALAMYTFSANLLRGLGRIKEYATIAFIKNGFQIGLNVVTIVFFHWGLQGLMVSLFASEVIAALLVAVKMRIWQYVRFRHLSWAMLKSMQKYSLPLIPNIISTQIISLSDRVIISQTLGVYANGIYSVSYKFPSIIDTIYIYFYNAWGESAARVLQQGKEKANQYYQSLYNPIDNVMFSVVLCLTAGMGILFRIFVRGVYVEGFAYVPILLFAMYFDCIAKFYAGIFTAIKQTKIMATSTMIAAIVNVVINLALIRYIGLYAAAGSTLIAEIVLVLLRRNALKKHVVIALDWKRIAMELLMTAVVLALYSYNSWWMIGLSLVLAIGYSVQ